MRLLRTPTLPEVIIVEPTVFSDDRGWFMEGYHQQRFADALRALGAPVPPSFVQDNQSSSKRGVLRGLHYQLPPRAQGKLVRVLRGAIWDVAVDIRRGSDTFARWAGVRLSAEDKRQLWIPVGFAHAFLALEDDTEVLYKTTDTYAPEHERSVAWNDARLAIRWPAMDISPRLSPKDAAAPRLEAADLF
jgi:dTDP-4-dehydrorhamnose 3,5-epimerase